MSTLEHEKPEDDPNLTTRELVYVAFFIITGMVFAIMILTGSLFFNE